MAATPPPPKRIRTPPTPLHGPQNDTYEPYSPRRSTRIAKLNSDYSSPNRSWNSTSSSSAAIHSARSPSGTFSPPQSPLSPAKRSNASRGKLDALTPRKQRKVKVYEDRDSESDTAVPVPQSVKPSRIAQIGAGMLPTPSKTPKKRVVPQELVQSASRVLFPGRPAKLEDAMPPTKKSKRSKIFSLDGLDEASEEEAAKIPIYTDSKDRVPDLDEGEDNPFLSGKGGKSKSNGVAQQNNRGVTRRSTRRGNGYDEEIEEMERKVRNDEGMIYVFRGRKVFRRFDNAADATAENGVAGAPSSINEFIKRKAGAAATERFTRSSVAPRLLFPNADQQREREERARREEEEAVTDIEVEEEEGVHFAEAEKADFETATPVESSFDVPATPPSTGKAKRKGRAAVQQFDEEMSGDTQTPEVGQSVVEELPKSRKAKVSPFDSWQRTKTSSRAVSKGTKRESEADSPETGGANSGKRVRIGTVTQT